MAGPSPSPRPLRVLVVEDNEDARESLCMLLDLWGYPCQSAPAGPEALDLAAASPPDVVLMDIGMPGMDGWMTARELRRRPGLAGAVIVATTGYGRGADVRRSLDEGFAAHLTKPYDPAELRRLLEGFAGRTGNSSEAAPAASDDGPDAETAPDLC